MPGRPSFSRKSFAHAAGRPSYSRKSFHHSIAPGVNGALDNGALAGIEFPCDACDYSRKEAMLMRVSEGESYTMKLYNEVYYDLYYDLYYDFYYDLY